MGRSDAELLEASKRGERAAYGALIERYQGVVCAVSYARTGDQSLSEDVAQDTFIAAWRQLHQVREPNRLRAWLCGIARNLARKARRRSAREAPLERALVFEGANPFDAAASAETDRVVRDALERVPESYRDVLVLYYRDHRSVRDVAAALGLSEAAALQRLSRGRQYLADGVTDLVERSLRGAHPRRNLAALVLAALPATAALAPSRAEAATHLQSRLYGGSMIKLALAAVALTAAGTTAYVATRPAPTATAATHATATQVAISPTTTPAAPVAAPARPSNRAVVPANAGAPAANPGEKCEVCENSSDEINKRPAIDAATMERVHLTRGPAHGPANAPVTIVMFTDMGCSFCSSTVGALDQLRDEYPGKLRLVIKQMPVHPEAQLAAEAALAADDQGKFWPLYDQMIAHEDDLSRDNLLAIAGTAGLDVGKLRDALDKHTYKAGVDADMDTAKQLEIGAVPTFVINGKRITGALPIQQYREVIDQALADAKAAAPAAAAN
jgi:RNA polymerase sigma factor (sigma-70 family)